MRMCKNQKLVSIIVPVYNDQDYLSYCIESLIGQSYSNLEIILIDDGSSDNSGQICDDYAARDSRIRVIHQPNGGISRAQNVGLDIAQGEYIAFADNDDILDAHNIEFLVHALESTGADMSKGRWQQFGVSELDTIANQTAHGASNPESITTFTDPLEAYQTVFCKSLRVIGNVLHEHTEARYFNEANWCRIYRREIWAGVRFPENTYAQDTALAGILYSRIQKVADINVVLYYWLQHPNSVTHKQHQYSFYNNHITVSLNNIEMCRQQAITPARSLYTIVSNFSMNNKLAQQQSEKFTLKKFKNILATLTVKEVFMSFALIAIRLLEKQVYDRVVKNIK